MKIRTGLLALLAALALALSHGGSARAQQTCVGSNCSSPNPEPSPATGTGDWVRATSPTFSGTVQIGSGSTTSTGWYLGYAGFSGFASIWPTSVTPTSANYVFNAGGAETTINAPTEIDLAIGGIIVARLTNPAGASPSMRMAAVLFANLGTPSNGTQAYCSNCTQTTPYVDTTCVGGGTGAIAYRLNGAWKCFN